LFIITTTTIAAAATTTTTFNPIHQKSDMEYCHVLLPHILYSVSFSIRFWW
jgi:hypothetical protein